MPIIGNSNGLNGKPLRVWAGHALSLVAAGLLSGCAGLVGAGPTPVAAHQPARAGIGRNQSLPTAAQVPLDVPEWITPDNRRRAVAIYDHVRERLIRARVDYRASVLILASITENREADFLTEEQFSRFGPAEIRPNLYEQFRWRAEMIAIARSTLERFAGPPGPPPSGEEEPIRVDVPPPDGGILGRITSTLEQAFEGFESLDFPVWPVPAPGIAGPFKWRVPIRIAPTGSAETDRRIAAALAEISRNVPSAPIDRLSFPAPAGSANVFLQMKGESRLSQIHMALGRCLQAMNCLSVRQIMTGDMPARPAPGATRAFLARAYLTRPYRADFGGPVALLEVARDGSISGAMCGSNGEWDGREHVMNLTSCLAQALGAHPPNGTDQTGYHPDFEAPLVAREMEYLRQLYD
jgi:hypothetical protein